MGGHRHGRMIGGDMRMTVGRMIVGGMMTVCLQPAAGQMNVDRMSVGRMSVVTADSQMMTSRSEMMSVVTADSQMMASRSEMMNGSRLRRIGTNEILNAVRRSGGASRSRKRVRK